MGRRRRVSSPVSVTEATVAPQAPRRQRKVVPECPRFENIIEFRPLATAQTLHLTSMLGPVEAKVRTQRTEAGSGVLTEVQGGD